MFAFDLAFAISFAVVTLTIILTKTMKHKFSASRPYNHLTLKPYYILIVYISMNILVHSSTIYCRGETESNSEMPHFFSIDYLIQSGLLITNLAGCLAITMQSFEWFMYAKLV